MTPRPLPISPFFHVRPANRTDYAAMTPLFAELDRIHREARPDIFRAAPEPARDRDFIAKLANGPDSAILLAVDEWQAIGLAVMLQHQVGELAIQVRRRVAVIDNIVVAENRRRCGVGRALLLAARNWARERQADFLELAVHDFNADALAFYEAHGFRASTHRLMQKL